MLTNKAGPVPQERPDLGPCWLFLGKPDSKGYGQISDGPRTTRKTLRAHRLSYETHCGKIPDGLDLDHLCRVRLCVNPAHLEPVTRRVNIRRALSDPVEKCRKGHRFTVANTYIQDGRRSCKICRRDAVKRCESKKAAQTSEPGVK